MLQPMPNKINGGCKKEQHESENLCRRNDEYFIVLY